MPSGRVHSLINLGVFAVIGSAGLALHRSGAASISPETAVTFTIGFFAGTFLLSPDLDLAEGHVDSKRAWGLFGVLWVPYGKMFSHRGWSHSWIVGPLTRLVYLGIFVAILVGLVAAAWPSFSWPAWLTSWTFLGPLLAGYYASQWLHLLADGIRPDHKMRARVRVKRRRR